MKKFKELKNSSMQKIYGGGSPLFYGANGYLSRDKKGHYHYTVTKGPFEAATGVMVNGWANSAAGGFGFYN